MGELTRARMATLIFNQTISVSSAVEDCFTPRTLVQEKIRARLRGRPVPDFEGIPEELVPYVKAYWEICYFFLQEERQLLEQMITDLYADEDDDALKDILEAVDLIDRRLEAMQESALFLKIKSDE